LKHILWALNQISSLSLQHGNAREAPEGKSGRLFFRHFFATRQRNGIQNKPLSARRYLWEEFCRAKFFGAGKPNSPISTKQNYPRERM